MKNSAHETNARSVISFLIVLLAFGMLLIFYTNKDSLMMPGTFPIFMTLVVLGLGLLVGLLYLISAYHTQKKMTHHKSSKSTSKKKKSR